MQSPIDEQGIQPEEPASIQSLCAHALKDRKFAVLLEACLADPVASRVLLLHRTELFPRLTVPVEGMTATIGAGGLPFLSDSPKLIRRSLKSLASKYARHSPHPERTAEAQQRVESIQDAAAETVRDAIALAILNTIAANAPLLELVNGPRPVDRAQLRRAVKDYAGLDWSPATSHLGEAFASLWRTDKSRRPVQQLLIHLDALKDALDLERFKTQIVEWLVTHFQRLLQIRSVRHDEWAALVLELHHDGFLEHAGPLYNWCVWCDETGVFGAIHTSHVGADLFCCKCRRKVPYMAAFYSTGAFDQALELHDGMLAAALGWHLTRCGVAFEPGVKLPETELDFVLRSDAGNCLIECKMNHLLGQDDALRRTLYKNREQLRDHLRIAKGQGMELRHAACVVNLTRDHLSSLLVTMPPETDLEFARVQGQILSYEDVATWLRHTIVVSA
jgi:hypothetical protein